MISVSAGSRSLEEMKLVVEMPVHGGLDRGGADPDRLTAHQGGDQAEQRSRPSSTATSPGRAANARSGIAARNAAQCFFSCSSMSASAGATSG